MITLKNIAYHVGDTQILSNFNLHITPQQHTLILGHSGSGKTTLLHLLAGLLSPSAGEIYFGDTNLCALSDKAKDQWRGAHIGMVFQTLHLVQALTVEGNLRLALRLSGKPQDDAPIAKLLIQLGLADKAKKYPHELSVGQAQRVAIARAAITKPAWILADEPTSGLDDMHCEATIALLREQAEQTGATLIIATHDQRIKQHFSHTINL